MEVNKNEQKKDEKKPVESQKAALVQIDREIVSRDRKKNTRLVVRVVVLNIVNLLIVAVVFFLISRLPGVSNEIKDARSSMFLAQGESDAAVLFAELDKNSEKIEMLRSLKVDADGLVNFVTTLRGLVAEGVVSEYNSVGSSAIKNSSNQLGYPVVVKLQGSQEQIDLAIKRIFSLPALVKPVNIEVQATEEDYAADLSIFLLSDE